VKEGRRWSTGTREADRTGNERRVLCGVKSKAIGRGPLEKKTWERIEERDQRGS